jgi:hypothetical protein
VFTSLKNGIGDMHHIYFSAMKEYKENAKQLMPHDFQKYLLEKLNIGFKQLVKNEGIEEGYRFALSSPNTFPTKFVLYFQDKALCRIDVLNKVYGVRSEQKEEYLLKQIEDNKSIINDWEKELQVMFKLKEKPFKQLKSFPDLYILLFKRKKLTEELDKRIKRLTSSTKDMKETISQLEKDIPSVQNTNLETERRLEKIETLLIKNGYSFTENKSLLY